MTTKNIQDVVAERVEEFINKPYIEEDGKIFVEVDAHWLTTTLTQLVKEVEAGERERYSPLKVLVQQMYRQMEGHESVLLYDIVAMAFDSDTGIWPPGKSAPMSMHVEGTVEERSKAFREWVNNFHELAALTPPNSEVIKK